MVVGWPQSSIVPLNAVLIIRNYHFVSSRQQMQYPGFFEYWTRII
jgi:hypothetical protein